MKNINLGQQLLLKSFFAKFNFKNNLLLKLGCNPNGPHEQVHKSAGKADLTWSPFSKIGF